MAIQFQRLLDVAKATDGRPDHLFDLAEIATATSCGTVCCLIGSYNLMVGREPERFGSGILEDDWDYFGITQNEYAWLFAFGAAFDLTTNRMILRSVPKRNALARLRKFIYYKLHKHEMCYDEKYGVKESARRAEGNHGFAMWAVREAVTS